MRIFRLGAELQLSLYINVSAVKMRKLIVVSLQRFVLEKVTLRTIWTYEHHLLPLFMERHPEAIMGIVLSPYSTKNTRLLWLPNTNEIDTNNMECTWPTRILPNVNYIPFARVGGCVGSGGLRIGSAREFRYQHVGIGNAKSLRWGSSAM